MWGQVYTSRLPTFKNAEQIFEIKDEVTCISKNLVYCITLPVVISKVLHRSNRGLYEKQSHGTQATDKPSGAKVN